MVQRRVRRIPVDWSLSVRLGEKVAHGRAVQFSEQGMLVGPSELAKPGEHCELSFYVPGLRSPFRVSALALYSNRKGIAFRFEHLSSEVIAFFREYIKLAEAGN